MNKLQSLLVIGLDVTSLAKSAHEAGYEVYSVDYFGDEDLRKVCKDGMSIIKQKKNQSCGKLYEKFILKTLLNLAEAISKKYKIDKVLLSSGLDDHPEIMSVLNDYVPILGNSTDLIKKVRDKFFFFEELTRLGIPHPITEVAENRKEAYKKAQDIGYPVVIKPFFGCGGIGLMRATTSKQVEEAFNLASSISKRVLIQKYVWGKPASASLLSVPGKAITLTVNEQLLGMRSLGQNEEFGYCGNIVPISSSSSLIKRCERIVEKVVAHFGLIGSNGIDFILSPENNPIIIEVNPRFQGTLECVERVLGINVSKAHIDACISNLLPKKPKLSGLFCTRLILFAKEYSKISNIANFEEVRDIPLPETIIEKGEPMCSIITLESSKKSSFNKAKTIAKSLYTQIQS